jgi:cytidylate kinase
VIFDPLGSIGAPGWRETLCRELADRLEVPWVDAGAVLQEEARARGVDVDTFFRPVDRHPTGEANGLIARAVAERVRALGWIEPAAGGPR